MHERPLANLRVIILDDDAFIAYDLEKLCRSLGASEVSVITDLAEISPAQLAERHFHLAILDAMVRGRSTAQLAKEMRARNIELVFATSYSDIESVMDEIDCMSIVEKPFVADAMVEALSAAAQRVSQTCR